MTKLYDDNASALLRFFARRTLDAQTSVDLVAETFAQAIKSRARYRGDCDEDAKRWIYGIARHLLNGYYRSGQVEERALRRLSMERPELDRSEITEIERVAGITEQREILAAALADLKPEYRDAIRARFVEQRDYSEIAAAFGTSEDVIRARVSRGLKRLRVSLSARREVLIDGTI